MRYFRLKDGQFVEWRGGLIGSVNYPQSILSLWPPSELATLGILPLVTTPVPPGMMAVSTAVENINGLPTEVHVLAELPVPAERIEKNAIWSRATDEEAIQMRAALTGQTVRIQEIYAGATHISTDNELFGMLQAALVALFGAPRAGELLTPTD